MRPKLDLGLMNKDLNQNAISGNGRMWDVQILFGRNGQNLFTGLAINQFGHGDGEWITTEDVIHLAFGAK